MNILPLPTKLPLWEIASFKVDRPSLRARIGIPHCVETDGSRTFGGEEDGWGFVSNSGQRIVVVLRVPYEQAVILADPPDAKSAVEALAEAIGDSVLTVYERAYPQT